MVDKFEVGKKYKFGITPFIYTCLWITPSGKAVMLGDTAKPVEFLTNSVKDYVEYVEPKKGTMWFNIYKGHDDDDIYGIAFRSKDYADSVANSVAKNSLLRRLACIEVPWVEGQGLD